MFLRSVLNCIHVEQRISELNFGVQQHTPERKFNENTFESLLSGSWSTFVETSIKSMEFNAFTQHILKRFRNSYVLVCYHGH